MSAQAGKRHMAWALGNVDVGVRLFDAIADRLDIFDGKAEMIQARSRTGLALQECEADDTVAQMAAVFVVFAFFISHAVGDFLHAEYRLIKLRFTIPIFGQHGDMSNAGKHSRYPPV